MKEIHYPENLNERYLDTIIKNPQLTIDGFYCGPYDEMYEKKKEELIKNCKLTFVCEEWVDYHYFAAYTGSVRRVPDTEVLELVERESRISDIPLGCLQLATIYRNEPVELKPGQTGIVFLFDRKGYRDYRELHDYVDFIGV